MALTQLERQSLVGAAELSATMKALPKRLWGTRESRAVIGKAIRPVARRVKREAPVRTEHLKRDPPPGELKRRIKARVFRSIPGFPDAGAVISGAPHSHLVNNGTVKTKPNPYFDRAVAATQQGAVDRIVSGYGALVEKGWRK